MQERSWLALFILIAICLAVGALGSIPTAKGVREWYPTLHKPAGTPPSWVFGPVWTSLHILMAISAWLIWRHFGWEGARTALTIFALQLALNLLWSWIFFGAQRPGTAFVEIVILWLTIALNVVLFYGRNQLAAALLVPYLLWVTYASYLNFGIWRLNP